MTLIKTFDYVSQALIFILGVGSVGLVGSKNSRVRRWGYLCGVLQEPFWFYSTAYAGQWFIFASAFLYTAVWCRGLYNNWRVE